MAQDLKEPEGKTFVEVALTLGGKTAEEATKTGTLDRADEQVEALFSPQYQTANSPAHRAIWDHNFPVELFDAPAQSVPEDARRAMDESLAIVRRHKAAKTLLDDRGKITDRVLDDLAGAGYWGLLVDREYGGRAVPFTAFAKFLTQMATIDATVAGLASVHGCIGAVDPLRTFGTPEQKRRILPRLASGEHLSAFALTEPGAGSDLTALKTTARLDGDDYVVDGEKLFITNAVPGRTVGLVCLIDGKPAVLIADLPEHEDEHFRVVRYGLYALKHSNNNGLRFRGFRVPKENLLVPARGDGLTVAYHGLNLGRVALCAAASGTMRVMLANMLPWAQYRKTYGAPIGSRELVRRRIGRLAALIAGCDALVDWCGSLLDRGYRGEMECIIAKIFGSESQKEAAIELFMKTHGGRAFLHGHLFGDNVHEYLAPCIYEGEGEMLGMAFFKSLVKEHGKRFFEPIGMALAASGIKKPNMANPAHLWALRKAMVPYAKWRASEAFAGKRHPQWQSGMDERLRAHAQFAADALGRARLEISETMVKHQLKLADRQCRMSELSSRLQDMIVILATSLWGARQPEGLARDAADILCRELARKYTGRRISDADIRAVTKLGESIESGGFAEIAGIEPEAILMPYDNVSSSGNGRA